MVRGGSKLSTSNGWVQPLLTFNESGDEVCLTIEQVVMADCDEINLVEALFKWYLIFRFGFWVWACRLNSWYDRPFNMCPLHAGSNVVTDGSTIFLNSSKSLFLIESCNRANI